MSFTCSDGNPQRNLYLDHDCPPKLDRIEAVRAPGFAGEKTIFIHEYGDSLCLYTGSAVQVYARDLSKHTLIGSMPTGPSMLFLDDGAWGAHEGPVKRYDKALNPILEEYVVPHGGPWTRCLGLFPKEKALAMALGFSGGPRVRAPSFFLNLVRQVVVATDKGDQARLEAPVHYSRPGEVESVVQLEGRLYLGGEKGLIILSLEGAQRAEVPLEAGYQHLAASLTEKAVGGFSKKDNRWLYLEFDDQGKPRFDLTLSGAESAGYVVFDPEGSRYLMSDRRLVKVGKDGQRQWSYSLQQAAKQAPRPLVFKEGRCAFIDGHDLVILDPAGVQQLRLTLPARKISSPPYLDTQGTVWIGLANQAETLLKVMLTP